MQPKVDFSFHYFPFLSLSSLCCLGCGDGRESQSSWRDVDRDADGDDAAVWRLRDDAAGTRSLEVGSWVGGRGAVGR